MRILLGLAILLLLPLVTGAVYIGIQYPAAAAPALLGALLGSLRFARGMPDDFGNANPRSHWLQLYGACTWPALLFGALGYAAFAALGVGVPDPNASLPWRLFGGAVFGALAGVVATWTVALITSTLLIARMIRRYRRHHGAA
jgi:hypothetical protein